MSERFLVSRPTQILAAATPVQPTKEGVQEKDHTEYLSNIINKQAQQMAALKDSHTRAQDYLKNMINTQARQIAALTQACTDLQREKTLLIQQKRTIQQEKNYVDYQLQTTQNESRRGRFIH